MDVSIKNFEVDMKVKNKGIELDIYDHTSHLGDLVVTKTKLIWCKGKTNRENGKEITWKEFMEYMEGR